MARKNRAELKSYFVKNAIPTEDHFADLIDSHLHPEDGVFKRSDEPLSVVAAPGEQKRVLRLYASYPAANPDWMISLNPAQDPANAAATSKPGFGITDGAGQTRLFVDNASGRVGVGTNTPQFKLDVAGDARVQGRIMDATGLVMPQGAILMWRGSSIPQGWALCDGTNNTPDLRGRFVLGSGQGAGLANRSVHAKGGAERVQLTIAEMPSHNHHNGSFNRLLTVSGGWTHTEIDNSANEPNLHDSGVLQAAGGNQPHENMPPFYVLAFIMKL
ncbi:MAG: hypothetical protein R3B48_22265 [Kofleriaceae bacterium]